MSEQSFGADHQVQRQVTARAAPRTSHHAPLRVPAACDATEQKFSVAGRITARKTSSVKDRTQWRTERGRSPKLPGLQPCPPSPYTHLSPSVDGNVILHPQQVLHRPRALEPCLAHSGTGQR